MWLAVEVEEFNQKSRAGQSVFMYIVQLDIRYFGAKSCATSNYLCSGGVQGVVRDSVSAWREHHISVIIDSSVVVGG